MYGCVFREVDPDGGAALADGAVEFAEGWAFAAAVLPAVAACDAAAAATVRSNLHLTAATPIADGYAAVKAAFESTYACLGVTCADIGAMLTCGDDGASACWAACDDDAVVGAASDGETFVKNLHGSGTTNPSKFYWETISILETRAKLPLRMTYRGVGSSTGQYEFVGVGSSDGTTAYNDFGSGDMPLSQEYYDTLMDAGIEVMHAPIVLGAMSFFHNIPGVPNGGNGINLTACLLARIFARDITTWDDDDIAAINPILDVPKNQAIIVYHRTHGSSTTSGITTYLNTACPDFWTADMVGSTVSWDSGTYAVEGSGGMSTHIAATDYSIGYIDSGHGHDDKLREVELENADGFFQSSAEAIPRGGVALAGSQAIATGVLPTDPTKSFANVSFHNMPGNVTWPIVAVSYIYIRTDQSNTGWAGPLLKAFLTFCMSDEGQALVADYNFVGLPNDMIALTQTAIGNIVTETGYSDLTFESSTDKGGGQDDYVFSVKRQNYFTRAVDANGGVVKDLEETTAALQTQIDTCLTDVKNDTHNVDLALALVVLSLVLALAGLGFGFWTRKMFKDLEKSVYAAYRTQPAGGSALGACIDPSSSVYGHQKMHENAEA